MHTGNSPKLENPDSEAKWGVCVILDKEESGGMGVGVQRGQIGNSQGAEKVANSF